MKCRPEFWIRFRSWSRCTCSISHSKAPARCTASAIWTPEYAAFQQRLRTADETGVTIVQNYSIDALPFLSYDLLSVLSAVLTALLVGLLVFIFIWMRRKSR